jgi:choline-sulfatase
MVSRRNLFVASFAVPRKRQPNFLFLFPDQWRPDWTPGNASVPAHLPNLTALAARGVQCERVLCASPLCAPSRACLATGRNYDRCGVVNNGNDFPLTQPTFYQALRKAGYHTMACGKVDLHKKTRDWGLDGKRLLREWGFSDGIDNAGKGDAIGSGAVTPKDPYMYMLHNRGLAAKHVADMRSRRDYSATHPTPLPEDAYCDNWIAHNARLLLDRAPKDKPWHLTVNFTGPHNPMDITAAMDASCRGRSYPAPNRNTQYDAAVHRRIRQNYTAMCENIDARIGEIIGAVAQRGELENTLIIFSSDHGEMLGDHNRWGKHVPYQASAGIPLIVSGLDARKGVRSNALAGLIDVTATFLDYAGAAPLPAMDAISLRGLLSGRKHTHRTVVHSGLEEWRLVWDGRYKLIKGYGSEYRLYDLNLDPLENENRFTSEKVIRDRLMKAMS